MLAMLDQFVFGKVPVRMKLQGLVFFTIYVILFTARWNWKVRIAPMQLINSFLDFEETIPAGQQAVEKVVNVHTNGNLSCSRHKAGKVIRGQGADLLPVLPPIHHSSLPSYELDPAVEQSLLTPIPGFADPFLRERGVVQSSCPGVDGHAHLRNMDGLPNILLWDTLDPVHFLRGHSLPARLSSLRPQVKSYRSSMNTVSDKPLICVIPPPHQDDTTHSQISHESEADGESRGKSWQLNGPVRNLSLCLPRYLPRCPGAGENVQRLSKGSNSSRDGILSARNPNIFPVCLHQTSLRDPDAWPSRLPNGSLGRRPQQHTHVHLGFLGKHALWENSVQLEKGAGALQAEDADQEAAEGLHSHEDSVRKQLH